jgi:hypothetical protein
MPSRDDVVMSSQKHEPGVANPATRINSSFWTAPSGAVPGRPSQANKVSKVTKVNAAHSFQDFQESVSDAWDLEEPLTPSAPLTKASSSPPHSVETCSPPKESSPPKGANPSSSSNHNITPIHSLSRGFARPHVANNRQPRTVAAAICDPETEKDKNKAAKIDVLLSKSPVDMVELSSLGWSGVPARHRSTVWKILCGYLPPAKGKQDEVLARKRDEYQGYVNQYFNNKEEDVHKDTFRQIAIDVPRMSPLVGLFQQKSVQEMVERILYIWAIRHPASGYVQGINDLVTPFLMVFLQDFVHDRDVTRDQIEFDSLDKQVRDNIEADSFWCMSKVLDGIQDNYTFAQPGIQVKIRQLEELLKRVDLTLHNHIVDHDVQYLQFSFRWMNNLLLRELPLKATIRLWDTYLAETDGFSKFHLYVCAAFLSRWKQELQQKKDFQGILLFIQNVPTAKWKDNDISMLVAEAYKLKYMFADAPNHLTECRINKPFL